MRIYLLTHTIVHNSPIEVRNDSRGRCYGQTLHLGQSQSDAKTGKLPAVDSCGRHFQLSPDISTNPHPPQSLQLLKKLHFHCRTSFRPQAKPLI